MPEKVIKNKAFELTLNFLLAYTDNLTKEEKEDFYELINFKTYKKGEFIYRQGDTVKNICFLVKGAVRSFYVNEDGKEHNTAFFLENEPFVPFASFVEQTPSTIFIEALENIEITWTSRKHYLAFLEKYPRFQIALSKLLSEYLLKGGEHLKLMRIESSRERYESLIASKPELVKRIPLKHIASYLGMALETLSRIRAGKL